MRTILNTRIALTMVVGFGVVGIVGVVGGRAPRPGTPRAGAVRVVAVENFWGSIAAQIAGGDAEVTSVIHNPATDPHDYEPTPQDARKSRRRSS